LRHQPDKLGERLTLTENSPFRDLAQFQARNVLVNAGLNPFARAFCEPVAQQQLTRSVKIEENHGNDPPKVIHRRKLADRAKKVGFPGLSTEPDAHTT
jgi:hypothetical protein